MNNSVFIFALLATCFNRTTTLTIEVTSDIVTVREGEQLNLSCSLILDSNQSIIEVRWFRDSVQTKYGFIDVTQCGVSSLCPEVNTTDNRGVVNYTRGFLNEATLTLVIDHSLVRDNTSFSCGLLTASNAFPTSDNIHVTVQHLPDPTYPMCSVGPLLFGDNTTDATTAPFDLDGTPTTLPADNIVVIVVTASASLVIIIIILIIIAYLVSSRKRRANEAEPMVGLHLSPVNQNTTPPTYERTLENIGQQDGDSSTGEQPSTVAALPTHYEPVQVGGGSTPHAGAQRHPGRRVQDTFTVTTGHAESGYQTLEMTNQQPAEYTKLELALRDG